MILLRSFLSGHIRIKRTLEYYDAGIGPRVPFGGGFGPTVSAIFATALGDYTTLSTTSSMPDGGSITRAGNAMLYDSTGKLTYAPNNQVFQSQALATSPWAAANGGVGSLATLTNNFATAPDNTTTATRVQCALNGGTTSADRSFVSQNLSLVVGTTYVVSFYAKLNTGTSAVMYALIGGASQLLPTVTNSWQRFNFTATATATGSIRLGLYGGQTPAAADSIDLLLWGVLIEAVTYQTTPSAYTSVNTTTTSAYYGPRFDYDSATLAAKGLLVEGARTNLQPYSQSFNNWTAGASQKASFAAVSTTQPDGTATGYALTEDSTLGLHQGFYGSYARGSSSALTYTATIYAKSTTRRLQIQIFNGAQTSGASATYDLVGGQVGVAAAVFGSYAAPSASIQSVGNSWYRCQLVFTTDANSSFFYYLFLDNASGTAASSTNYTGNGTANVNVFGAQVELGAFASSYIPTTSGSLARAAETFTLANYQNRLVESFYIDEETGGSWSANIAPSATSPLTISTPSFGWVTSLRPYTNAYAGDISTPSWIDNSGTTGNRMYYDSTGALTWAPSNMLLNSATLSTQTVTVTSGATNILSFSGTGSITYSGAASGTLSGTGVSNRVSVALTMTTASLTLTVSGSVTSAQLERVTYQTQPRAYIPTTSAAVYQPRYDYDPSVTPATPRGMLIEESRANLLTYSEQFDNAAWTKSSTSITVNSAIAPDGTTSADTLTEVSATAQHIVGRNIVGQSGVNYTFSFYVKANNKRYVWFNLYSSTAWDNAFRYFDVFVDLNTATIYKQAGQTATFQASVSNVGNGWYRLIVSSKYATVAVDNVSVGIGLSDATGNYSYAGDGASSAFIWGAQLEAGSFPTSYIPTTTASVTRVADVVKLSGSALTTAGAATGSAIVQTSKILSLSPPSGVLGGFKASGGPRYVLYQSSDNTTLISAVTGGNNVATLGSGGWTIGPVRGAAGWDLNGFATVGNNGTVLSQTAGKMDTATEVCLGSLGPSAFLLNGWAASLALYNQRLPDAILKQKSSVNAPY